MKEFTLKNRNFLLVEVPDDGYDYIWNVWSDNSTTLEFYSETYKMEYDTFEYNVDKQRKEITISMTPLNLKIIGKLSDILKDENICSELADWDDWSDDFFSHKYQGCFRNYQNFDSNNEIIDNDKNIGFDKATDSFHSFLQSQQIDLTKNYLLIEKL